MIQTTEGAYVYGWGKEEYDEYKLYYVSLRKTTTKDNFDVYEIFTKSKLDDKYAHEFGYLLVKDGKPLLLTGIPGDNYGATIFKGVFKVSGHDGSYLFDIDNPLEYEADLR